MVHLERVSASHAIAYWAGTPEVFWGTQESLGEASQCWHLARRLTCDPPPLFLKTLHKGQRYRWLAKWLGSRDCSVFKFECLLFLGDRKLTLPVLQLGGVGYNYQYTRYCKENLNYTARVTLLTAKETKLSVIFYSAFWLLNNSAWKTAWPWDTSGITVAKVHRPPAGAAALNLWVMAPCLLLLVFFNL